MSWIAWDSPQQRIALPFANSTTVKERWVNHYLALGKNHSRIVQVVMYHLSVFFFFFWMQSLTNYSFVYCYGHLRWISPICPPDPLHTLPHSVLHPEGWLAWTVSRSSPLMFHWIHPEVITAGCWRWEESRFWVFSPWDSCLLTLSRLTLLVEGRLSGNAPHPAVFPGSQSQPFAPSCSPLPGPALSLWFPCTLLYK